MAVMRCKASHKPPRVIISAMAAYRRIVILTGAGLSAESGLSTFRDKDGIWHKTEILRPSG